MPKIVDPDERRREVAEATWRVIRRDGLAGASVRNVARESGLSMGSLRHYFTTQADLLEFALRLAIGRIEARLNALEPDPDPRVHAERVVHELLPLDAERRAENEIWLAFTAQAMVDPGLHDLRATGYHALQKGCRALVRRFGVPNQGVEAMRLHALVDGLAVHAAVCPDVMTPTRMRAVVAGHLDELAARAETG